MEPNFTQYYKTANRQQLEKEAMEYLVTDTLQKRLTGPYKSKQFTAMDMESHAPAKFVPSMFYTFMYNSPTDENVKTIQFKDRVPLIFCTSYDNGYVTGINFNLIPCSARPFILDKIIYTNINFYENDIINAIPEHNFVINDVLAKALINPEDCKAFIYILENETGLGIHNCFRTYKEEYIMNVRLIEYDMWKYIPFLTFKDAVRGLPLAKLQQELVSDAASDWYWDS